jgi:hypothetical protein
MRAVQVENVEKPLHTSPTHRWVYLNDEHKGGVRLITPMSPTFLFALPDRRREKKEAPAVGGAEGTLAIPTEPWG